LWSQLLRLDEIKIQNFRKHSELIFSPSEGINLIFGPNGSGKTNILEAIHYCALTKGFNRTTDRQCMNFSAESFLLKSLFTSDTGCQYRVHVDFSTNGGKSISLNNSQLEKFSALIGLIPCILFSPAEITIVHGSPQERRRFLDNALCQISKSYLEQLLQYRRILQQRNALLHSSWDRSSPAPDMNIWTELLAESGAFIIKERMDFLDEFQPYFSNAYAILDTGEIPRLTYRSSLGKALVSSDRAGIADSLMHRFGEIQHQEQVRKQTLLGPHRDEILFYLDGSDVKKYASQGQTRTFLIALKVALQRFLFDKKGEQSIFLLDDIFSELDQRRVERVLEMIAGFGQSLITSTEKTGLSFLHEISIHDMLYKHGDPL